jgi:hypothetical protein
VIELSEPTWARIRALFPADRQDAVARSLRERCGDNLPLVDATYAPLAERIRFAVLKLSAGDDAALDRHLRMAAVDWRDVLVAAGFGNDTRAHMDWMP